jgi:6-phosphogluconate dehydrogenase
MQLIAEAYDILKRGLDLSNDEIADIFVKWNKGVLDSFLIEITANILKYKDDDNVSMVDKILDSAGQKGTGKWTAIAALDAGMPGLFLVFCHFFLLIACSNSHWRSRLRPLLVVHKSRTCASEQHHFWPSERSIPRRQSSIC